MRRREVFEAVMDSHQVRLDGLARHFDQYFVNIFEPAQPVMPKHNPFQIVEPNLLTFNPSAVSGSGFSNVVVGHMDFSAFA